MAKTLLITVDTEGDNLWNYKDGATISTENCTYIPRFQELCESFGFIPTYLTNYEMAMDKRWVMYGRQKQFEGKCEIGLHIHAWNSPPYYYLEDIFGGNAYITEYPEPVIEEKISNLCHLLSSAFDNKVSSARSGRWATNDFYFSSLIANNIHVDCSITPFIDHTPLVGRTIKSGPNYKNYSIEPSLIYPGLVEIPMTTRHIKWQGEGSLKHRIRTSLLGDRMWLRPIKLSKSYLKVITDSVIEDGSDYLQFMIHSSELMPGCSPYFKTNEEVDMLFNLMKWYFMYIFELGFTGSSLTDYAAKIRGGL